MRQLKNAYSVFFLLISIFLLQSCHSLPTKHYQALPVVEQVSTEQVDQLIPAALAKLGYRVNKDVGDPIKFIGLMKVPKDTWNRDYRLTVQKSIGQNGSTVLIVEAQHCSGCIVTMGDQLSPVNRVKTFAATFSHLLSQQVQANSVKIPSHSQNLSIYEQYFRGEKAAQTAKPVQKSIKSIPKKKAPSETVIIQDNAKQAITANAQPMSSAVPDKPSIEIASIVVQPLNVPASTKFDVSFIFKVSDSVNTSTDLVIQIHYEIWLGKDRLFTSEKTDISASNGGPVKRVEHVRAGAIIGEYQIRVIVSYRGDEAIKQTSFKIINAAN